VQFPLPYAPLDRAYLRILGLSEDFLHAVLYQKNTHQIELELQHISLPSLYHGQAPSQVQIAFWINQYNAWHLWLRKHTSLTGAALFRTKKITIGKRTFSLDDIEHQILRGRKFKFGLGYLPSFWLNNELKKLAVAQPDYRIHFVLHCGAVSCPPLRIIQAEHLEEQLDTAARSFISADTRIDHTRKQLHVSAIFGWYVGDFGGMRGLRQLMAKYHPSYQAEYSIRFKRYDWNPTSSAADQSK
jgi:hypothetical protein